MAKMIPVTIIYFDLAGVRRYVSATSTRFDKKKLPIYTDKIDEAKDYENEEAALAVIPILHNPHNRDFKTMPHQISQSQSKLSRREQEEEELC